VIIVIIKTYALVYGQRNKMKVKMYNEEMNICHESGKGYDLVLKKIDPLLNKNAKRLCKFGYEFEDAKQELVIMILRGIRNYDIDKGVKLSTFLHIHLNNKIISKIKTIVKKSNVATENNEDGYVSEVLFSDIEVGESENYMENCYDSGKDNRFVELDDLNYKDILQIISTKYGKKVSELLYLISYKGYSMVKAAEKLEMNPWTASNKIKSLSKDPFIKSLLYNE